MGAGASCRQKKETPVDPKLKGFDAGMADSYKPNEIREIKITDTFSVLVSLSEGKFYSYGSKCPHYGAALVNGAMEDGMIKCPWHGACFDIKTGDIEDHPGLHSIPTYRVIKGRGGHLTVYPSNYDEYKVHRPLSHTKDKSKLLVILGGGAAGFMCALTLRENCFEGRIVIVSKDSYLPYDRTKLSKTPGCTWEDIKLVDEKWYTEAQVEVMLNAHVEDCHVELKPKKVFIRDFEDPILCDQLLIATGCKPKIPTSNASGVEGSNLKNVLKLYNIKDAAKIKEKCGGKDIVIIGSGFLAMELASSLPSLCKSINIIGRYKRPYGLVLGETVGKIIQQHVVAKSNVKYRGCDAVKKIVGNKDGSIKEVVTLKKKVYPCDIVIFAIGAEPNTGMFTDFDTNPPLTVLDSGHIPVNENMQTNIDHVYAAGDCARIPLNCSVTKWASVGHWGMAQKMGRIAALNMLGLKHNTINTTIPFFWHNVSGISIRYTGYGEHYDESLIFGNLEEKKFCVLYRRDAKILACCTCNCDPIAARMSFDMQDEIEWDGFPPYITELFPAPPIIGETIDGLKFVLEDRLTEFDANQQRDAGQQWVERRHKSFNDDIYQDKEYAVNQPPALKKKITLIQSSNNRSGDPAD